MLQETPPFGRWLKRLRNDHDLTQEALAEQVGCAGQTIRMFESGARRPSRDMAKRLAACLDVPLADQDAFVRAARDKGEAKREDYATSPAPVGASCDVIDVPAVGETTPAQHPRTSVLPIAANVMIGREAEYTNLSAMLLDPQRRLVTVVGPGGIGKTRLALQLASDLSKHFQDGAAWVSLAPIARPDDVPGAIADALGLMLQGTAPLAAQLLSSLQERQLLLVLDNFEHLLGALELVVDIVAQAPAVTLLVTSRERLRVGGEWAVEVAGLQVPQDADSSPIERAAAVLLFVERARQAQGDFALTPTNRSGVARICQLLEGMPLGIELAATWTRMLTVGEIEAEIGHGLDLLSLSERNAPSRHTSLRAVFDHSWQLLTSNERMVLQRLAVFTGGFERQAALAVTGANVRVLAALVDKSLVVADMDQTSGPRYRLLVPIRQYALERLEASGEWTQVHDAHARCFLALADLAELELKGPHQVVWTQRLANENANVRAALQWGLDTHNWELVVQFGWDLHLFWWYRGLQAEGRSWIDAVLAAASDLPTALRARALCIRGSVSYGLDHDHIVQSFLDSATLFVQVGDAYGQAYALAGAGLGALAQGDAVQAIELLQHSLALHREHDNTWMVAQVSAYAGLAYLKQGAVAQAIQYHENALVLAKAARDWWGMCLATCNLALVHQSQGNQETAMALFREGIVLAQQLGNDATVAYCIQSLAAMRAAHGATTEAVQLYGAADALLDVVGRPLFVHMPDPVLYEQTVAGLRARLGATAFTASWREGRAMSTKDLVDYVLAND